MKKPGNPAQAKPTDKAKKKLTPAEQAKLDEEMALRALKRSEENKKYGIRMAMDDFPLLLTGDFLNNAWESERPKDFVYEYLTYQFDRLGILYNIKPQEQKMYSNQILLDLIFVKKDLKAEGEKQTLLSNLLFANFTNKDTRYSIEYPPIRDTPFENEDAEEAWMLQEQERKSKLPEMEDHMEPDDYRSSLRITDCVEQKTYAGDLADFKQRLGRLIKAFPQMFIDKNEVAALVNHAMNSYFANFNLFRYITMFDRTEENITMQVSVDEPTVVAPLSDAVQTGKLEEAADADKAMTEEMIRREQEAALAEEARRQEEELERKKQEEWMGLDDKTIALIQERINRTKEYMLKKIESKKEEYNEKLTAAKVPIKKK